MNITNVQIKAIMPNVENNIKRNPNTKQCDLNVLVSFLNKYAAAFGISTAKQWAYFLAQIAHESAEFRYTEEIASGAAYDTGSLAKKLGNTPQKDGDGQKYKGRGYIQLTGTSNYRAFDAFAKSRGITVDFVKNPARLAEMSYAVYSAFWFWWKNNLNRFVERNDFDGLTRAINGGTNGLAQRKMYLNKALKAIS